MPAPLGIRQLAKIQMTHPKHRKQRGEPRGLVKKIATVLKYFFLIFFAAALLVVLYRVRGETQDAGKNRFLQELIKP